jgi:hypothetical protein
LEPLLLHRSKSLERLQSIELYIRERHDCALLGSVFDDVGRNSFAVRYFDSSEEHRSLLLQIKQDAEKQRQAKIEELNSLNDRRRALENQAASLEHEDWTNNQGRKVHSRKCSKCSLTKQAKRLKIDVYEWPLPQNSLEAKTVVFELSLPLAFSIWRATTYKILRDICNMQPLSQEIVQSELWGYKALKAYQSNQASRITLASTTKSFLVSHYRQCDIPAETDSVCVNNGLHWRFVITYYELRFFKVKLLCILLDSMTSQSANGPTYRFQLAASNLIALSKFRRAFTAAYSMRLILLLIHSTKYYPSNRNVLEN